MTRPHLFVCTNERASGKPACGRRGGAELLVAVQQALIARGSDARVTGCACLGPCFDGPNAVSYPDGTWYGALEVGDAAGLAEALASGSVYAAKRCEPPGADDPST